MMANGNSEGLFPVVVVKMNGITVRASIDSDTRSSYAWSRMK